MELKVTVDLRNRFGEIHEQGTRPTCLAFAASDGHAFARGNTEALSTEYVFFHAVQKMDTPDRTKGLSFRLISLAMANDGQPIEQGWPYLSSLASNDPWEPPPNPGTIFRRDLQKQEADVASIYTHLDAGQPVIVVMRTSRSFFAPTAGTILQAPGDEVEINKHAVLAVGYGESDHARYVLIRNSWGKEWGDQGYAWVHEEYLQPRLRVVCVMN